MAVNPETSLKPGYDFGGWATKYNTKCSDGRTILPNAFAHADGLRVPLVWQHMHNDVGNVLGHADLEHREDGVYAWAKFNNTEAGQIAKALVHSGDIDQLSIYANQLNEKNNMVHNGVIRELSLVLSGANKEARIEHLSFAHGDGSPDYVDEEEAIIYTGEALVVARKEEVVEHAESEDSSGDGETIGDVFETLTDKQKTAVYALLGAVVDGGAEMEQSSTPEGENSMKSNAFESDALAAGGPTLSHEDQAKFLEDARRIGSLREAARQLSHAGTYGIDNIGNLFPDYKALRNEPDLLAREQGWVRTWMSGTHHTPFSRIKSTYADLTPDAARAKGYITGNQKVEEVFAVLKRTTDPTTVYKKQKLDRDDIVDITDFNVVSWLKAEMRMMLEEEIARACLVGDGRTFGVDDDAIDPSKVRPIYGDDAVYSVLTTLEASVVDFLDIADDIVQARTAYRGSGSPTMFAAPSVITSFLLLRDTTNRRMFRNLSELAAELNVSNIVEVEVLEGIQRSDPTPFTANLLAIIVNPRDYTIGADKGGEVNMFDDFDIDYNQYKYLIETRISAALTKPKSALCIERKTA